MVTIAENLINLPNVLTILRFVFSPIFLYLFLNDNVELGLIIFMFVAVTDLADGWIARSTKTKTKFGEFMDPMADKFMVFLAILAIIIKFDFPLWSVPLFIIRDIISLVGSILVYTKYKESWKPNVLGKLTTFLQIITILAYIIKIGFKLIILDITIIFSVLSAIVYIYRGISMIKGHNTKNI